jgi:alkyldihydroxyacetonephosphate synthase
MASSVQPKATPPRVETDPSTTRGERFDAWGYEDTNFALENDLVTLKGSRYELSGKILPGLMTWASSIIGQPLHLREEFIHKQMTPIAPPKIASEFLDGLTQHHISWTQDDTARRRHGHGHALEEVYAIRLGRMHRAPDAVTYPENEAQVVRLVQLAQQHRIVLVPYGGGTNVSHALMCPESEPRAIVSMDMRRMNQILELDETNRMAHIQAGAVGQDLQTELEARGYTLGHEPDSIEFSTLGGWIATRSSGMKKNRYGNIEDLVLDVRMVTAKGVIEGRAMPRESMGIDPRHIALGSEGNFGVITSAKVKIFPLPEVRRFDSVLFHDFESGLAFMQDLSRVPPYPASARLLDNFQFQFGQALKPESHGWKHLKSQLERRVVTGPLGFEPDKMCAFTLLYEGSREEVALQTARVAKLAKKHRGFRAGGENGKRGYQLTFSIAYIRDFMMQLGIMAESFETSVAWSDLAKMCVAVRERILAEHKRLNIPGNPIISWRVTQVYHSGAAVYFYLAILGTGLKQPAETFSILEHAARETILEHGGSISHHHGVGKLRAQFVPQVKSAVGLNWIEGAKQQLDPENIFGIANQGLERKNQV